MDDKIVGPITTEEVCHDWNEGLCGLTSLVWADAWDPGESSAWVPLAQPECAGVGSLRAMEVELLLQLCLDGALPDDSSSPTAVPDIKESAWTLARNSRAARDARAAAKAAARAAAEAIDAEVPACPICLDGLEQPAMLGCGHVFCTRCIATYTRTQLLASRLVSCPCCKRPVSHDELAETLIAPACGNPSDPSPLELSSIWQSLEEEAAARRERSARATAVGRVARRDGLRRELGLVPPATSADGTPWTPQEQRAFERTAARLRLRRCPACQTPIQKQGGCDHMTCRCGNHFSWANAEPVVACSNFHRSEDADSPLQGWYCCRHCSPEARAKLAAARLGRVVVCVPVVAAGAGAATAAVATGVAVVATVAVVPAAVCLPLAVAYEPVRRVRNELAYARAMRDTGEYRFFRRPNKRCARLPKKLPEKKKNVFLQAATMPAAAAGSGMLMLAFAAVGGYESD